LAREADFKDSKETMQLEVAKEGASGRHHSPFESVLGSRTSREGLRPPEGGFAGRGRGPGHLTTRFPSDPIPLEVFSASLAEKGEVGAGLGGKFSHDALQGHNRFYSTSPHPTLPHPTPPPPPPPPHPTPPHSNLPDPTLPYPTLPYPTLPHPTQPHHTLSQPHHTLTLFVAFTA
jgi:hypothetical protein